MGAKQAKVRPIKVVVDTNVLVSGFLWQGNAKEIFVLAKRGIITLCVTEEIIDEFQRVLEYPKFAERLNIIGKTPVEIVDEFMEVVEYYPSLYFLSPQIIDDPTDDIFLACALSARASYIISGDHHPQ